jgi:nifR3 family TIM-barrel protein
MTNFWQDLHKPFTVLAPMDDVTDHAFRELIATHLPRPDVYFTEFTNANGLMSIGRDSVIRKFKYSKIQRPIVAQIWGSDPDNMGKAAALVEELGFDGVDINMGCPDRTVVKSGAGAGHIRDFAKTAEIISAVKKGAKNIPISIKTRLGYNKIITDDWVRFLLGFELDALTIHGRTATQMSDGSANWEEIGHAVKIRNEVSPSTIIIGNGDIETYKEVCQMHTNYHVDGVMIGRGIFKNPWVFSKSIDGEDHSKEAYIKLLVAHMNIFVDTWGETKNFAILKKFFKMYVKGFDGANELRIKLMECKSKEEVLTVLNSTFEGVS